MTKTDNEGFKNSTKFWICDNVYTDGNIEVRDHCHTTGKYRDSSYRDCNIKVKLNLKIPVIFHKPKKLWLTFYFERTRQNQF